MHKELSFFIEFTSTHTPRLHFSSLILYPGSSIFPRRSTPSLGQAEEGKAEGGVGQEDSPWAIFSIPPLRLLSLMQK